MHIGEALLPRPDAIRLAQQALREANVRNARYYERVPALRPNPDRPLVDAIRADDTIILIPFERSGGVGDPVVVRVNGVTKAVVVQRGF